MQRAALAFLMLYAAVGLIVSLYVHLVSFVEEPPGGQRLFTMLHIGIFPLWVPAIFLFNAMSGRPGFSRGRMSFGEVWSLLGRAPALLRWMTVGFAIYAFVNFALFIATTVRAPRPTAGADPSFSVWHGFSGHWMLFYSAGLTITTIAFLYGTEPSARRCPNGHFVGADDSFCPRCGRAVGKL